MSAPIASRAFITDFFFGFFQERGFHDRMYEVSWGRGGGGALRPCYLIGEP